MTRARRRRLALAGGVAVLFGVAALLALRAPDSTESIDEAIDESAAPPQSSDDDDPPDPVPPPTSDVPEVTVGLDGWLFFTEDVDPDCGRLASLSGLARLDKGPDVLRSIVNEPKSTFHPEQLDPRDRPADCVAEARQTVQDRMATDPLAVDIDAALRAAQRDGTEVFSKADSHWSPEGRIVAAEALIESIEPGLWDPAAVGTGELPKLQDLNTLLGAAESGTITGPTVDRGPVTLVEQTSVTILDSSLTTFERSRSDAEGTIGGTTYIVGDSQLAHLLPEIESYFEELVFINWFLVEVDAVDVDDLPDPDRLIVQTVERDALVRFADPLLDELAARLPP